MVLVGLAVWEGLQQHCLDDIRFAPAPRHSCTEGTEAAQLHHHPQEGSSAPTSDSAKGQATAKTQHTPHAREGAMLHSLRCGTSHWRLQPATPAQAFALVYLGL